MGTALRGHIDQVDGRDIVGWLQAPVAQAVPLLCVNNRPARLVSWPTPRPDVSAVLGIAEPTGFRFAVDELPPGATVSLYAVGPDRVSPVQSRILPAVLPAEEAPAVLAQSGDKAGEPALILLWKQHDAGIYGRRVDQIARSCRRRFPGHRVIVLELLVRGHKALYAAQRHEPGSDAGLILDLAEIKAGPGHVDADGVRYELLEYADPATLRHRFLEYLAARGCTPRNTAFVVFPVVDQLDRLYDVLHAFPLFVDVVDNQLVWSVDATHAVTMMTQYASVARMAARCLCNSDITQATFCDIGIVPESAVVSCIPNWYTLPAGQRADREPPSAGGPLRVLYSGNMNDRIDWALLQAMAAVPGLTLHLVGAAGQVRGPLTALLRHSGVVYHGPLSEGQTLALLRTMHAAVIPHCDNTCSRFMNPMKAAMYLAVGVPVLCVPVPGIAAHPTIHLCADGADMVARLRTWAADPGRIQTPSACINTTAETAYLRQIESLLECRSRHEHFLF